MSFKRAADLVLATALLLSVAGLIYLIVGGIVGLGVAVVFCGIALNGCGRV